jgi:hypothetical protein
LSLRSNPGLKLANAFGVSGAKLATLRRIGGEISDAFRVLGEIRSLPRIGLELANAFGVFTKIETDAPLAGALWRIQSGMTMKSWKGIHPRRH